MQNRGEAKRPLLRFCNVGSFSQKWVAGSARHSRPIAAPGLTSRMRRHGLLPVSRA